VVAARPSTGTTSSSFPSNQSPGEATSTVRRYHAYIVWHGESEKYRLSFGTDTFVVRGGTIVLQSFAGQIEPN